MNVPYLFRLNIDVPQDQVKSCLLIVALLGRLQTQQLFSNSALLRVVLFLSAMVVGDRHFSIFPRTRPLPPPHGPVIDEYTITFDDKMMIMCNQWVTKNRYIGKLIEEERMTFDEVRIVLNSQFLFYIPFQLRTHDSVSVEQVNRLPTHGRNSC